jgi:hypothetical protein
MIEDRTQHPSQDPTNHQGTVLRLHDDGRVPSDNPYVGHATYLPEIWSWGHRNPQGLAIDPVTNQVWSSEHGPQGGDETRGAVRASVDPDNRNAEFGVIVRSDLKGSGLDEGASTRLLVHAARLMVKGVPPVTACRAAIDQALTDDVEMLTAVSELSSSLF